ncbi:ribosome silencing factor [Bifidobacterium vespertilionis]|uniref:Ribosomal silencing factor RsfS n=1 Tax=Bifidobacterium vespertilionis TaxID=2562524 RepID=A0A5J5E6C7_9BIFI|nr:ribosome silencing factor [Bifidobacterium vespertilionis]KAA8822507.1 ribosome silencing factor [Bifidobacterium vespertilionis]KAA8824431.1 ribosome silencing factor [Bifidobacterium vespertilionis]
MAALQSSIDSVRIAALAADKMKATDIVAFDVSQPLGITDIFMIASARNERQVLAVAEEIEKKLYKAERLQPREREGLTEAQWVLLDYGDFVIHVMHDETREFYNLERLWKDCPLIELDLPEEPAPVTAQDSPEAVRA